MDLLDDIFFTFLFLCCRPLDMLSVARHRIVYTLLFGSMANNVFDAIVFNVAFPGVPRAVSNLLGSKL